MQLIVITGAAGFIGSGIVRYLNGLGFSNLILVDVLDHPEKIRNLAEKQYVELLSIDQLHPWLKERHGDVSSIIHLGACSDTLETNAEFLDENNFQYTRRLAEYALKEGCRFIYASSAATYGDGSLGFSDDHRLLEKLRPLNLYGDSKHRFDLWAKAEGVLDHMVGLKYFNVFGPNEAHKGRMASMVFKMVPLVQKDGVVKLYRSTEPDRFPDGGQCRDFIYVKDAARMTCEFLENSRGGIYNIGMGKPTTWNELASAIFAALDKPVQIEYIDMPKDLAKQYQNYTCAEMDKYRQNRESFLNYTINTAVKDYVCNHLVKGQPW